MIEIIFLTSFTSLGMFVVTYEGYALAWLKHGLAKLFGGRWKEEENEVYYEFNGFMEHLWKPFLGCPVCMSSFWGLVVYSKFQDYTIASIYEIPIMILCSCCLNFILFNNLIKKWLFS